MVFIDLKMRKLFISELLKATFNHAILYLVTLVTPLYRYDLFSCLVMIVNDIYERTILTSVRQMKQRQIRKYSWLSTNKTITILSEYVYGV